MTELKTAADLLAALRPLPLAYACLTGQVTLRADEKNSAHTFATAEVSYTSKLWLIVEGQLRQVALWSRVAEGRSNSHRTSFTAVFPLAYPEVEKAVGEIGLDNEDVEVDNWTLPMLEGFNTPHVIAQFYQRARGHGFEPVLRVRTEDVTNGKLPAGIAKSAFWRPAGTMTVGKTPQDHTYEFYDYILNSKGVLPYFPTLPGVFSAKAGKMCKVGVHLGKDVHPQRVWACFDDLALYGGFAWWNPSLT